ncbi:MAG TPA: hypothetical protein VF329_13080 [Gammaproteobacteria bacterium]
MEVAIEGRIVTPLTEARVFELIDRLVRWGRRRRPSSSGCIDELQIVVSSCNRLEHLQVD